jgi:hypothetical protein
MDSTISDCAARMTLRERARTTPITAPGVARGVVAPHLNELERAGGYVGVYRRRESESEFAAQHHLELVAAGFELVAIRSLEAA